MSNDVLGPLACGKVFIQRAVGQTPADADGAGMATYDNLTRPRLNPGAVDKAGALIADGAVRVAVYSSGWVKDVFNLGRNLLSFGAITPDCVDQVNELDRETVPKRTQATYKAWSDKGPTTPEWAP